MDQPGDQVYNAFISVVAKGDKSSLMAYIPKPSVVKLRNPQNLEYKAQWYNPQSNEYIDAEFKSEGGLLIFEQNTEADMVLKLDEK